MKALLTILLLAAAAQGQSFVASGSALPDAPSQHKFWTLETKVSAGVLAGLIAVDAVTTQRGLDRGMKESNPMMRPFVTRGAAGEAAGSAIGFGTAMGVGYLLHRTHHYKAERIAMRMMIGVESVVVANNLAKTW